MLCGVLLANVAISACRPTPLANGGAALPANGHANGTMSRSQSPAAAVTSAMPDLGLEARNVGQGGAGEADQPLLEITSDAV